MFYNRLFYQWDGPYSEKVYMWDLSVFIVMGEKNNTCSGRGIDVNDTWSLECRFTISSSQTYVFCILCVNHFSLNQIIPFLWIFLKSIKLNI